jgi:tetratricopeptide (TPR) repeat protein
MNDDTWNLIGLGRYHEAIRQYEEQLKASWARHRLSLSVFANKATAEMAAGRVLDAERTLEQSLAFSKRENRGSDLRLELSAVQWLSGHVEEAVHSLAIRIEGIKDGSVQFTDLAGGGTEGLILYYYGVCLNRTVIIDDASRFLKQIKERNRFGFDSWPNALVRWFLGELDDSSVLMEGCGTISLETALLKARTDMLVRRQLIEFCFHKAVRALRLEEQAQSLEFFETIISLENPLVSDEWYLARHEVDRLRRLAS